VTSPGEIQTSTDEVLREIRDLLRQILAEIRMSLHLMTEGFNEDLSGEDEEDGG